ncbi:MAG: hypothetical protein ACE5GQ_10140, partial [Nitrospinales bacterium]
GGYFPVLGSDADLSEKHGEARGFQDARCLLPRPVEKCPSCNRLAYTGEGGSDGEFFRLSRELMPFEKAFFLVGRRFQPAHARVSQPAPLFHKNCPYQARRKGFIKKEWNLKPAA